MATDKTPAWRITKMRIRDSPRLAMQTKKVAADLEAKARQAASMADSMGASEGATIDATIEQGVRPKGRPFANVVSSNVGQEYGDAITERRRILGRVAEALTTHRRSV